ncbi:MAG TPA: cupin domain-containing protein [Verrucomicrobiae bacterium]
MNGKVLKRSLPVIAGPPPPDAPMLKRLRLRQGELAHFWNGEEPIHYIAFLELRDGAIRGNHYHRHKREFVYVISGELLLSVADTESSQRDSLILRAGDLGSIDTGIAHRYQVNQPGQAVEFSTVTFNPADLYPWQFDDC